MHKKITQLHPKADRNSPCPCGSGKKYKKCCLSKHEEEERLSQRLAPPETLSDKYFSVNEYIQKSGYPVTMFDNFLIEILNIAGSILNRYQRLDNSKVKCVLAEMMRAAKDFYSSCQKCEHDCLSDPMKKISFRSLVDKGLEVEEFPEALQRTVSVNFFYFEFINVFIISLDKELNNILPEHEVEDITSTVHSSIFDFISDNCWEACNNECMKNIGKNAYCRLCSFGENMLPCPKNEEITYEEIKACKEDMIH